MDTLPKEVVTIRKDVFDPYKQGKKIGYYQLGKTIGEGSFAKVKEGIHLLTGEKVAVKIIDKKKAEEDRYISKNLRREAKILQLLRHPNIVQLFEVIETDGFYYLVMEFCAGGELLDYICSRKKLDETVARRLIGQLVSAVHNMHQSNIVHRDLKIENFLLSSEENLKIVDFGLSNTLPEGCLSEYKNSNIYPQLLNTHCGSPAYAAPELLAQKKYGPQIDVWSIGINMYAMLTGYLPYMMEPFNVMEMYEKMMQRKMTPIPNYLSRECRDLLMRLLEPVPEWRISLRQVMKHQWFRDSNCIPPVFDDSINQLVEAILNYMKRNLSIKTKDVINAVVSNKANHSSAVYHLINRRLTRYLEKNKNIISDIQKNFPKLEIIKKASLNTENKIKTPSKSKFTYQGKKIDTSNQSNENKCDEKTCTTTTTTTTTATASTANKTTHRKISATHIAEYLSNIRKSKAKNDEEKSKETNFEEKEKESKKTERMKASEEISKTDGTTHCNKRPSIVDDNTHCNKRPSIVDDNTHRNKRPSIVDVLRDDFIKGNQSNQSGNPNSRPVLNTNSSAMTNEQHQSSVVDDKIFSSANATDRKVASGDSKEKEVPKRPTLKSSISNDSYCSGEISPFSDDAFKSPDDWFVSDPWNNNNNTAEALQSNMTHMGNDETEGTSEEIREKNMTSEKNCDNGNFIDKQESRKKIESLNHNKIAGKPMLENPKDILKRFSESPKAKQKRLRKVSCPVQQRSRSPERLEYGIENLKSNEQLLVPNVKVLKENNYAMKEIRHDFVKTPVFNQSFHLNKVDERGDKIEKTNTDSPSDITQSSVKSNTEFYMEKSETRTKDRSFTTGSVNADDFLIDENNNDIEEITHRPKTSEPIPSINKISPSKKTFQLNVKHFTQFKTSLNSSQNNNQENNNKAVAQLKPLELNFNFDKYRKKKAYTKKQVTKSLTNINGVLTVSEKEPVAEQMLSMRKKIANEDIRQVANTRVVRVFNKRMDTSTERKISKTTLKVTTSAPTTLIRPNTKLKIKGLLSFDNPSDEEPSNQIFTIEKLQELRDNGEETPPFDSGFFGHSSIPRKDKTHPELAREPKEVNYSDEEDDTERKPTSNDSHINTSENKEEKKDGIIEDSHVPSTANTDSHVPSTANTDSHVPSTECTDSHVPSTESTVQAVEVGIAVRRRSIDSNKETITEVEHARFRCQPIYNVEKTQTPTLQRSVIKNSRDDSFLNRRCHSVNDRRFASMRAPTSKSFDTDKNYKTSFAEEKNLKNSFNTNRTPKNSRETTAKNGDAFTGTGFEKPKSAKLQAFLSMRQNNLDEGVSNFAQQANAIIHKSVAKNSVRQYPIERTFIGSASPKFHRRATLGNASAPTSGRVTPTLYDPANERKKLNEFSKALTNAVWRKQYAQK